MRTTSAIAITDRAYVIVIVIHRKGYLILRGRHVSNCNMRTKDFEAQDFFDHAVTLIWLSHIMPFFTRSQSQAVKIVDPTTQDELRPNRKGNSTIYTFFSYKLLTHHSDSVQRQCRNIMIYGYDSVYIFFLC